MTWYIILECLGSGFSGAASSGEASFAQAVVFVIGGGSFNEYHNLLDYAKVRFYFQRIISGMAGCMG